MNIKINCKICKYYYVTWERNKPHGCKAYGFKSQQVPSVVVRQSSGTQCSFYIPKR